MKKHYLSLLPFILWKKAPRPISWAEVFGHEAAVELEIGFGNGDFLVRQALNHPEINFVGVEIAWGSIRRTLRQIEKAGLKNVRLVQADSRVALERLFSLNSLHQVYCLFPMPWPKKHHEKHRLFSRGFLKLLNSRLQDKGEVRMVTDHEPYFNWVLDQLPDTGFTTDTKLTFPVYDTKYERKWQEKGHNKFFELNLVKHNHLEIPLKKEVTLKTYRLKHFDPENFKPINERNDVVVEFKEFLYDPQRKKGLTRVIVAEENLKQNFWIKIAWGDGVWHIKTEQGCETVPTVGVQRAVELVYNAASMGEAIKN